MAIFTAIATFLLAGTALAGTFAVTALAAGLGIATSIGLSYISKALAGNPNQDATPQGPQGVQGTLQSGADIPRSFQLGYSATAGSLVWANTWGTAYPGGTTTPNAYLTQVIALSDLPGGTLQEVWVNGELCTLGITDEDYGGTRIVEYIKDGQPYLWVKYYDGTQTAADPLCVNYAASADRPYESTRVGTGVAYVVVTSLVNDTLFTGFPTFKFAVSGISLYDPTKDDTNGGTGSHRWSDPSTWGGDGDDLPAVQAYNILRGIYYGGQWLYGLQRMTAARLPAVNWNTQIDKCRATITGVSGAEPTYRTGGQVSVDTQTVTTIERILTGCQGRLSEIGGFYKIHLGVPDSPSFSFTDDDILSTEEQNFAPFFGLADSVNGIAATYPSPAEGWSMKPAPPLYDSTFEAEDGSRRLLANPVLDFVPYDAQAQRLQKSALQEARRARRHTIVLSAPFWIVEPGDVGEWTSTRNGYSSKQFRLDGVVDKANLDVVLNLTEVDPTDYDWTHSTDFVPVTTGPTIFPRPAPQGVVDWFAEAFTLMVAGSPRRPAIRLSWDGSLPGVNGIQYEVRLTSDSSDVNRGRTDQLAAGQLIISQSLVPNTDYQVRGQYLPSSPRDMLWSDWLDVTTPDVRLTLADFDDSVVAMVSAVEQVDAAAINQAINLIASLAANQDARNWIDKKEVRSQLDAVAGTANASIATIQSVMADDEAAFATFQTEVSATFGPSFSTVSTVSSAVATLDGYAAASYSVTLDVNNYIVGTQLVNGGAGTSEFTVTVDKFQVADPGVTGGDPVPIFTVASVGGSPKVAIRGDMIVDGSITTQHIAAGSITAVEIDAGAITTSKLAAGAVDTAALAVGGVALANIIDGATSNIGATTTSGGTASGTPTSIGSVVLDIQQGRAIIFGICGGGKALGSDTARIYVDGSPVGATFTFSAVPDATATATISGCLQAAAYVTGLSAGNHTFEMRVATNIYGAGTIIVINPRR